MIYYTHCTHCRAARICYPSQIEQPDVEANNPIRRNKTKQTKAKYILKCI